MLIMKIIKIMKMLVIVKCFVTTVDPISIDYLSVPRKKWLKKMVQVIYNIFFYAFLNKYINFFFQSMNYLMLLALFANNRVIFLEIVTKMRKEFILKEGLAIIGKIYFL